ncbi:hypothetical protein SERLADRAFT_436047 [Serpula lacrymans var. lacrymans S7.9]|uniref:Uncharacterized protein n=1 Tax=Serpula lacrymans var. lacrymans (strain S7.9) TaxID=578457 RepID=F8NR41_SERL9|nr:uncharacterized protein SERLADRAFT_436047 [Serpula lacrymans var. lacrymans S7.9]EGO26214.1 hypothetical protein SERLADRAFT_436047 [Serpula lacrymans var. lacrymans S7.9]
MIMIIGGLCGIFLISAALLNVYPLGQHSPSLGKADNTHVNPFEAENMALKEQHCQACEYQKVTTSTIHTLRVQKAVLKEQNHLDHRCYHARLEKQESQAIEAKIKERTRRAMEDEYAKITASYHLTLASHEHTIKDISDKLANSEETWEQQKAHYNDQIKAVLASFNLATDYKRQVDQLRTELCCTQLSLIALQSSIIT